MSNDGVLQGKAPVGGINQHEIVPGALAGIGAEGGQRFAGCDRFEAGECLLGFQLGIFAGTVDGDNRRLIKWVSNSGNPRVLTSADLPELLSSPAFFARKFDETVDAEVLDRLEARLREAVAA